MGPEIVPPGKRYLPRFGRYDTPENGLRAIAKVLLHHYGEGMHTLREILVHYAPAFENDTEGYVKDAAKMAGVDPDEDLRLNEPERAAVILPHLLDAIVKHENREPGVPWVSPYDEATVKRAVERALV